MPTFYFSETPAYDNLDGIEFSTTQDACQAAVVAVKTIAVEQGNAGPTTSKMYVWDPHGVMIFEVSLTVEFKQMKAPPAAADGA